MKSRYVGRVLIFVIGVVASALAVLLASQVGQMHVTETPQPVSTATPTVLLHPYDLVILEATDDPDARLIVTNYGRDEHGHIKIHVESIGYSLVSQEAIGEVHWVEAKELGHDYVRLTYPQAKWLLEQHVLSDQPLPLDEFYTCNPTRPYGALYVCLGIGDTVVLESINIENLGAEIYNMGPSRGDRQSKVRATQFGNADVPKYDSKLSFMHIRWSQHYDGTVMVRFNPSEWMVERVYSTLILP